MSEQKQQENDGFVRVIRRKNSLITVSSKISMNEFRAMLSQKIISFYDKKGRNIDFDNDGIYRRYNSVVIDGNGKSRTRYSIAIKTYLHLMGDIVVFTWDNDEVTYTTKLNHPNLENWGGKMFLLVKEN